MDKRRSSLGMILKCVLSAILVVLALSAGCASVERMQRRYEQGDRRQLDSLMRVVAGSEYSYATRKKAASALGEIGDPIAVYTLVGVLNDPDPRDGLEKEAIRALAQLGDERAVDGLARVLDRQDSLRLDAIQALGCIGGARAAEVLVNGLRYYATLEEQRARMSLMRGRTGAFSGEEMSAFPPSDSRGASDPDELSMMGKSRTRTIRTPGGLFSAGESSMVIEDEAEEEKRQCQEVVRALIRIGDEAVPVLTDALNARPRPGDMDIRDQIEEVLNQILGTELSDDE